MIGREITVTRNCLNGSWPRRQTHNGLSERTVFRTDNPCDGSSCSTHHLGPSATLRQISIAGPVITKYDLLLQLREAFQLDVEIMPDETFVVTHPAIAKIHRGNRNHGPGLERDDCGTG